MACARPISQPLVATALATYLSQVPIGGDGGYVRVSALEAVIGAVRSDTTRIVVTVPAADVVITTAQAPSSTRPPRPPSTWGAEHVRTDHPSDEDRRPLGRVKSDLPDSGSVAGPDYYVPAAEHEKIKDAIVALGEEVGLHDGSTAGSLVERVETLEPLVFAYPLVSGTSATLPDSNVVVERRGTGSGATTTLTSSHPCCGSHRHHLRGKRGFYRRNHYGLSARVGEDRRSRSLEGLVRVE